MLCLLNKFIKFVYFIYTIIVGERSRGEGEWQARQKTHTTAACYSCDVKELESSTVFLMHSRDQMKATLFSSTQEIILLLITWYNLSHPFALLPSSKEQYYYHFFFANIAYIGRNQRSVNRLVHRGFQKLCIVLNLKYPRRDSNPELPHGEDQSYQLGQEPIGEYYHFNFIGPYIYIIT